MQKDTILIEGMSCNHCVASVTRALEEKKGVKVESVEIGKAVVDYDQQAVTRESLVEAIEEIGFDVVQA